jgi:[acyl-carrier-protein] S-malonyltransferase
MAAFIGADMEITQKILDEVKIEGICDIGNDNADGQVVISGDKSSVEKAIEISKDFGVKRAVILPVSAPFHCRLMRPAQLVMKQALANIKFSSPVIPVVSNTTALPEKDTDQLKQNLVDQVTNTVRWRETMHLANKLGAEEIIELGSGKVLTSIAKRMIKNVFAYNIEKSSDFKQS